MAQTGIPVSGHRMNRRRFLAGALGAAVATPAAAAVGSGEPTLRGTLNAAELGLGGKADDQTLVLRQLLEAASDGDRDIFLPAGTYLVSELKLPPRVRLSGVAGATRLVFGGGDFMLAGERCERVALSGLTIDGAGRALAEYVPGILHLAESRGVAIENCVIAGSTRDGLALDRSEGRVTRTTIRDVAGIGIRAVESTGLSLTDNTIEDCGSGGIHVLRWTEGDDGTVVTGNRIARVAIGETVDGSSGNGVRVFRAHGVTVSNNRITDCAVNAISTSAASNLQIIGNTCRGAGAAGVSVQWSFEGAMIANNMIDRAATGVAVTDFRKGGRIAVISGNILRDLGTVAGNDAATAGVGIAVEADAAVTGNVIEAAARYGMLVGWGPSLRDVAATGNVIRQSPVGIAVSVVDGAGSAVISDNLIAGAEQGAIVGMRWSETASGDLALTGARTFPHLLVERNRTG